MTKYNEGCQASGLFLPGWGATASLYTAGLPEGWVALQLPSFRRTRGEFFVYHRWLDEKIGRLAAPVVLAGHSMGAVLALLAAIDRPELVERLVLVSPAGLPLTKTMRSSVRAFIRQAAGGRYRLAHLGLMLGHVGASPLSALRVARSVHGLDLRTGVERFDANRTPCTVVGCSTDTLTPPAHCLELATVLGADYREVDARDGHIWPVTQPHLLAAELSR